MTAVIVTIWLSCLPLVPSTGKLRGIPADLFIQRVEVHEGDRREIQKLIEATKDLPLPLNCTIKYDMRPKP